jgi:hypothetical protein
MLLVMGVLVAGVVDASSAQMLAAIAASAVANIVSSPRSYRLYSSPWYQGGGEMHLPCSVVHLPSSGCWAPCTTMRTCTCMHACTHLLERLPSSSRAPRGAGPSGCVPGTTSSQGAASAIRCQLVICFVNVSPASANWHPRAKLLPSGVLINFEMPEGPANVNDFPSRTLKKIVLNVRGPQWKHVLRRPITRVRRV